VCDLKDLDGLIIPGGESTSMSLIGSKDNLLEKIKEFVNNGNPVWGTCAGSVLLAKDVQGQKIGGQGLIGCMDILVHRNFFGRQVSSFEMDIELNLPSPFTHRNNNNQNNETERNVCKKFPGIFIRAPAILSVGQSTDKTERVQVLGEIVVPESAHNNNNNSNSSNNNTNNSNSNSNNTTNNNNDSNNNVVSQKVIVAAQQGVMLATVFHPELTDDTSFHEYFIEVIRQHLKEKK